MTTRPQHDGLSRGVWMALAAGAVLVAGAGLLLVRSPKTSGSAARAGSIPSVGLARLDGATGDAVLREEAWLRDPTPLFLPTEWNAAQGVDLQRTQLKEPGNTFEGYPAKLTFKTAKVQFDLPAAVAVPASPVGALQVGGWEMPFLGFGRRDVPPPALAARGACIEVMAANDGRRVGLDQALPMAQPPVALEWQPLEIMAAVDAAGLVGVPSLVVSSGVEEVDQYFLKLLTKDWRVGDRLAALAPGLYRIRLGP
ncbi:MAG: hypothetical protein HZA31_00640 [Opitutae bacterium]|nr:hypothetical protein [Opitutae bacterium]